MPVLDITEWLDMMAETLVIEPYVGRSASSQPIYGSLKSYQCFIRMMNHKVLNARGQEVVARGYAILGSTDVIGIHDRVTFSSDYQPTQPPLISVDIMPDEW